MTWPGPGEKTIRRSSPLRSSPKPTSKHWTEGGPTHTQRFAQMPNGWDRGWKLMSEGWVIDWGLLMMIEERGARGCLGISLSDTPP